VGKSYNEIKRNLQDLINDNDIIEYCDLVDYLSRNDMKIEFHVASNHVYFFDKYISSRRNKLKENPPQDTPTHVDPETGEVLT